MQPAVTMETKKEKIGMMKSKKILSVLAFVQLGIGLFFILLEAIAESIINSNEYFSPWLLCTYGTGIWVGLLGVISAIFGVFAFRTIYGTRCLMTVYFILAIIAAVADGVLLIMASACISGLPYAFDYYMYSVAPDEPRRILPDGAEHTQRFVIALEAFLIIFAVVHLVCSIVSAAFICRIWCTETTSTVTVIYLPNQDGTTKAGGHPVTVPSGSQVIFIPANPGHQTTNGVLKG